MILGKVQATPVAACSVDPVALSDAYVYMPLQVRSPFVVRAVLPASLPSTSVPGAAFSVGELLALKHADGTTTTTTAASASASAAASASTQVCTPSLTLTLILTPTLTPTPTQPHTPLHTGGHRA